MRANNEWMVQDNELTTNIESQKKHQQTKPLQTRENTKLYVLETVRSACLEWKESQL